MSENFSWPELIQSWCAELDAFMPTGGPTVIAPAAAESVIAAVEARLGTALPESLREFYRVADGLARTGGTVAGIRPVESIGWFRDLESEWYETWREIDQDGDWPPDSNDHHPLMARALLVSTPGEVALLLDPGRVDPATGEWHCCQFDNIRPGASEGSSSFAAELATMHEDFVGQHVSAGPARTKMSKTIQSAYEASLAGDLDALPLLRKLARRSWRAFALAMQIDTFAPAHGDEDLGAYLTPLYVGPNQDVTVPDPKYDRTVLEELVPLGLVREIEIGREIPFKIQYAAEPVASRLQQHFDAINNGTGIVADFSYCPGFQAGVDRARALLAEDPDAAWQVIVESLPLWQPLSEHHLVPVGLRYDKDFRLLLNPPRRRRPIVPGGPTVLSGEYRYRRQSPRGEQVLATARGGAQ